MMGVFRAVLWIVACSACGETGAAWPDFESAKIDRDTMQECGDCCAERQCIVLRYVRRAGHEEDGRIVQAAQQLVACGDAEVVARYEALARAVRAATAAPEPRP